MIVIPLSRPLRAIDREFSELTIREPTGADLIAAGNPVLIHPGGKIEVDAGAMSRMIGRLAGLPADSVERMPARDWTAVMGVVMGFFGAAAATPSSTAISSAPAGGATSTTS